jgi:hypothetical protein
MSTTKPYLHLVSSTPPPATPSRPTLLRHIQALQVLALRKPRVAKAILTMTERLANLQEAK